MGVKLGGQGKGGQPTPNVNVTPLVDVTLVVLIIFMIMTPMMTKTFWLNLPDKPKEEQTQPPPKSDNQPLVMTVDQEGTVRVNETVLAESDIQARLPRMLAANSNKVLYFDAHDNVPFGTATRVLDLSRGAGARSIAILTQSVLK